MKIKATCLLVFILLFGNFHSFGITLTLSKKDASCGNNNGSITANVFTMYPPINYNWTSGHMTQNINNLSPGVYTLIVFDANGDSTGATVTIVDNPDIGSTALSYIVPGMLGGISHPCNNQCNGVAYLAVDYLTGTPPYSMFTSMGHTIGTYGPNMIPTVQGICSNDVYSVSVYDALGCPGAAFPTFSYPPTSFDFTSQITPACNSAANGIAILNFTNTQGIPYSVSWTGPVSGSISGANMTASLQNLLPGLYTINIVSDYSIAPCDTLITINIPDLGFNCGTISGRVYLDSTRNCISDLWEPGLSSRMILFNPGTYYSTSDSLGNYTALLPYGNYSATTISNQNYTSVCQVNGINLNSLSNNINGIDLGDSTGVDLDLEVNLTATAARPGFNYTLYATVKNNSPFPVSGATMVIDHSSVLSFITSASSYNVSGPNQLTVSLPMINAFGTVVSAFTFIIPPNPQLIGTIISNQAALNANQPEPNTANNLALHQQVITGSFDPNEKSVWPAWDSNHYFFVNSDNEFRYTIQFQNTGNDTAFTVNLVDTLNPYLKISSFEMLGSSHPCSWEITGSNILKVHYNNILLPDSTTNEPDSHGIFSFRIRPTPALQLVPLPYTLENRAAIYFDFNPPIITNTAFNTIQITVGKPEILTQEVSIYPNPAENKVYISCSDPAELMSITLMDLSGRVLITRRMESLVTALEIADLAAGMYLISIKGKSFTKMEKLIKK